MLASESPQDFLAMIESILQLVEQPLVDKESKKDYTSEGNRILLKTSTLNFIANLCVDVQLR